MRGTRLARLLGASVAVLALSALEPAPPAGASVPVLVLDGTGYGHGVGLSQWGAEHLARTGRSTAEIPGTFYPGASLAAATGVIRVVVHRAPAPVTTPTFPQGGELWSPLQGAQAPGFPVAVGRQEERRVGKEGVR